MVEIIPNSSVGPFSFNTPIANYLGKFPPDNIGDYEPMTESTAYYYYGGDLIVYTDEQGIIDTIGIYFDCYLKSRNLYRMPVKNFFEYFKIGGEETIVNDRLWVNEDEQQKVYEIATLGLQLWVDDTGMIATVIADIGMNSQRCS
ncbi:hypothetical protein CJD36_014025 [Flavipsychrobacter stenotrophus]|uniref:Uncharacterized protein n=1 Tax=Flavipsychrobacter stenotrophus TaxID=2077091 RepID=A0A2S7SVW6_9BACT|nr:hypothetical protein [Flavipsychrobacter stenotrophus]PQJ11082.1 hypothetical protein CJD36_014025 [Flavipsychrobacter stenotrophus]